MPTLPTAGTLGELEYENFNAAAAKVVFHGRNIHPGSAKNQMVNSQLIAMEFHSLLPVHQRPEATEGYEGFALLTDMKGTVELSQLRYIIRDHDMGKFTRMKELFGEIAAFLNGKYGEGTVELTLKDSYYNMKERILPVMHIIDRPRPPWSGWELPPSPSLSGEAPMEPGCPMKGCLVPTCAPVARTTMAGLSTSP